MPLTDGIFETGAYGVPSKSQNPTVFGQGAQWTARHRKQKSWILTLMASN